MSVTIKLSSPAVLDGQRLPDEYRCTKPTTGPGTSPALTWQAGPAATQSYAVTLSDRFNDNAHWTIYDIPAELHMLGEDVPKGAFPTFPSGARQAENESPALGGPGYFGPCAGLAMYQFKVYALDVANIVSSGTSADLIREQLELHEVASGTLTVTSDDTNK
ncbi:MAG: hypothetical protein RL701_7172 [Pseudomonadota bacterium]